MNLFAVDGVSYNVLIPEGGIKRAGNILDGSNAGRTMSGRMVRDIIGTYYNYTLELDTKGLALEEYDRLFEVLTAPVDFHTVTVPYGQGTITFMAYISNVDDEFRSAVGGRGLWGGLAFSFIAMEPQRTP